MMLAKKIAYNTVISAGARVIGLALSLITLSYLTRYLGQAGFGRYSTILAYLYIFTVLADLGLYPICLREISKSQANEHKIINNIFALRSIAGLVLFALSPIISLVLPYDFEIRLGIMIGAAGFWLMSNQQVLMGVFQKYLNMNRVALAEILSRAAQLCLVMFLIWQQRGLLLIIAAFSLSSLINFLLIYFFIKKYVKLQWAFDLSFWWQILKESVPLGIATILTLIYFKLDTVMLSFFKNPIDVGIYSLAYKILESLLFFPSMFVGLMLPLLSRNVELDPAKFLKLAQKTLDVLLIFVVLLVGATFFLSGAIISLISGPGYAASANVLNILIIATGLIFLAVLFSNMIIVLKKQKLLVAIYGFGAVFNVTTNLIFIPRYSYLGAASTTLATEFLVTCIMLWYLSYQLKIKLKFNLIFKCLIAFVPVGLALWYLALWPLFVLIVLAGLIYFIALYLVKGISRHDLALLIKPGGTI